MAIRFLLDRFAANAEKTALVCGDRTCTYDWLLMEAFRLSQAMEHQYKPGTTILLEADYSPEAIAHLLTMIQCGCIVTPIRSTSTAKRRVMADLVQAELIVRIPGAGEGEGSTEVIKRDRTAHHEIYDELRGLQHPGLVLLSSGSTGQMKAAVHDLTRLLAKYHTPRRDLSTIAFLLFEHIGGLDTLFYCLSNTSMLVVPTDRTPETVCAAVEKHRVEVLPVSPTFLNMLILSEAWKRYDLSSLKYVTYGSEVMPEVTLSRCAEIFKGVTLLQKYGTTEVGTLRSQSKDSTSLWIRVGGEGYQTRIVDGMLQIKAASSMLGYLNAPSPFTEDGWFITGDAVEVDGDYIRILGRKSEIINVGGLKVYPAQVEGVIQELPEVAEVSVYGERNPLMGNIVCARVTPARAGEFDEKQFVLTVKAHCRAKLPPYQVPVKIQITSTHQHSERFKKMRPLHDAA